MKNGELKLPHNRSTFTLSYVALSYTSPDAIQYAYRLEGSDKDWIYMKQNKDVTFANLSPGDYVFRVKSTNSSGVWQDNETTLRITVTPPFWATGWALLIYFTILCLLIVLWYNYKKPNWKKNTASTVKYSKVRRKKNFIMQKYSSLPLSRMKYGHLLP